jgi:hexokinase
MSTRTSSYITQGNKPLAQKTALALDAGGTNLRISAVSFDSECKAQITGATVKSFMPGTRGKVNETEFFDHIADNVIQVLEKTPRIDGIGFTFSYPMEMQPDRDGILLNLSKEVDAKDLVGKAIGRGLREALARKGKIIDAPISLLNDTAATLLSGIASIQDTSRLVNPNNPESPVVGFILGTGFNTAYPETNIPKINFESKTNPQIVVCETGSFNLRYRGALDIEFDNTTKNPGAYTLEKTTSGAYFGPLCLSILKQAVKDNVLQLRKNSEFLAINSLDTKALNEFVIDPLTAISAQNSPLAGVIDSSEKDAAACIQYLVSIVTERAALFSASILAATVEQTKTGYAPHAPVRIAVEGSTYMFCKGMRRALDSRLHGLLMNEKPLPYIFAPVEQASLFGAAVAALSY